MSRWMRVFTLFLFVMLLRLGSSAWGGEVQMSGVLFLDYNYVLSDKLANGTDSKNINAFDVPRVYLNLNMPLTKKVRGYVQLEANKITVDTWKGTAADNKNPYLKKVFLEVKDVWGGHKLRFGLIPTPWIGPEEHIWKHRFVSKVLPDIDGVLHSTDRGISLSRSLDRVSYDLLVVNGEGKGNEISKHKDFIGKASVLLLERQGKLKAHLYLHKGKIDQGQTRDRTIGGISYESKKFNAMGSYYASKDDQTDGRGFSLFGVFHLPSDRAIFLRYDNWDADKDKDDSTVTRWIAGFSHKIVEKVRGSLNFQFQDGGANAPKLDQKSVHYTIEVKF